MIRKLSKISLFIAIFAMMVTSCGSSKHAVASNAPVESKQEDESAIFIGRVNNNASTARSISSSIDFTVGDGKNDISVGGKLRMMRDQVIRINLVFLGIKEVGVIEFTPTYVQIIDRMHTQYVKESYDKVDFLAKNGLTFYSLQSLFWNELFYPGEKTITDDLLRKYSADAKGENMAIGLKQGDMSYCWTANRQTAVISATDVKYVSKEYGTTSLHWSYSDFKKLANKSFPYKQSFNLFSTSIAKGQKATVTIEMSNPEVGKTFDVTTTPSSKYKKVKAEDLLKQLLNM